MSLFIKELKDRIRPRIRMASSVLTSQAINVLRVIAQRLSRGQARRLAFMLGDFMRQVLGLRRDLVYTNLALTFPEKSRTEIHRIAKSVYRNVAASLFEVLRLPLIRTREDVAALVDIDARELLAKMCERHSGAVVVSAHYGNWELMALAFGVMVHPLTIIVKRLRNATVDRRINEFRTMQGNSIVYDDQALREGLRLLADGGFLAILGDQSDPAESNFCEFLGRRATMFHGAAFFALKAQVPLFVGMCRSNGDGRYTIDAIEIDTSDLTFNKEDIATLALRYTRVIEEYIRRWPEEWFWLHDRWKRS